MEKEFFVLFFVDWTIQIAGKVSEKAVKNYSDDHYSSTPCKIVIKNPMIFNHFTVEDKNRRSKTVQTGIREVYPLPTDQNEIIFDSSMFHGLEVISEIAVNESGEYLVDGTTEVKLMYSDYRKVVEARKKKNSDIIMPTTENVSEINKYKVKL